MRRSKIFPVVVTGWIALGLSILIPLTVSLASWAQTRDLRCTDAFEYTFAPLLVTCGQRTAGHLVLGWLLTGVTVGGLVVALAVGAWAITRRDVSAGERFQGWLFAVTVAVAVGVVVGARVLNPDSVGVNAWILPGALGAGLVAAASAVWATVTAVRALPVHPSEPTGR